MKNLLFVLTAALLLLSCNQSVATTDKSVANTIADNIAKAHGIEAFDTIQSIDFTWNVSRSDGSTFSRRWIWKPKLDSVTAFKLDQKITYNWKSLDSITNEINKGFVNDKYWLFAPFQLVWDQESFIATYQKEADSPGGKESMQKLTIVYNGDSGGYTPGDAYDFYFKDDFIIREWVFRRSNQPDPNLISICESYVNLGGLLIAEQHNRPDNSGALYFTDLRIE